MGNNNSIQLDTYKNNVCTISESIKQIYTGIPGSSASPTEAMVVEFKNNTKYKNKLIKYGFLKIWIDPISLKYVFKHVYDKSYYSSALGGLNYEIYVYRHVIRELLDYNICPNFIKYLGSSKRCSWKNLTNITSKIRPKDIKDGEHVRRTKQNIIQTIYSEDLGERQAIDSDNYKNLNSKLLALETLNIEDLNFNILVNEAIEDKYTETLRDFLLRNEDINELNSVMFQCMAGCYAMSMSKMVHNDLHTGNIWVIKLPEKRTFIYNYNYIEYMFETQYMVKIYDFDRSYVERFGNNPQLDEETAGFSQSNEYIPNRDMIKCISYFYKYQSPEIKEIILESVQTKEENKLNIYIPEILNSCMIKYDNVALTKNDYIELFQTREDILYNIAKMAEFHNREIRDSDKVKLTNEGRYYYCNKEMFDNNGDIFKHREGTVQMLILGIKQLNNKFEEQENLINNLQAELDAIRKKDEKKAERKAERKRRKEGRE